MVLLSGGSSGCFPRGGGDGDHCDGPNSSASDDSLPEGSDESSICSSLGDSTVTASGSSELVVEDGARSAMGAESANSFHLRRSSTGTFGRGNW